jgi:hypothetical protein
VVAIKHPDLANAIDRMYEAAACPELWPKALGSFANALGGFGGSIVGFGADEKLISYVSPESVEVAAAYARGGWADQNFRIQLGSTHAAWPIVHSRKDGSGPAGNRPAEDPERISECVPNAEFHRL